MYNHVHAIAPYEYTSVCHPGNEWTLNGKQEEDSQHRKPSKRSEIVDNEKDVVYFSLLIAVRFLGTQT